mmetsp:Transcript_36995/g.77283  ORF Transcript_36995/g.77283 Transcript_36995/m.77283 type:complete len:104 (-) Transcript_36995:28-339(-)
MATDWHPAIYGRTFKFESLQLACKSSSNQELSRCHLTEKRRRAIPVVDPHSIANCTPSIMASIISLYNLLVKGDCVSISTEAEKNLTEVSYHLKQLISNCIHL